MKNIIEKEKYLAKAKELKAKGCFRRSAEQYGAALLLAADPTEEFRIKSKIRNVLRKH